MSNSISSPSNFFLKVYYFILSTRPKTLLVTLSPALIIYTYLKAIPSFNLGNYLVYIFSVLFMQIACNFTNEHYDFIRKVDNEKRLGPKRMLQQKKITLEEMRRAIFVTFFLAMVGGLYLSFIYGIVVFFLAVISFLAAYFYTGGKNPYGYKGLGEIMAFIFFGPVLFLVPFITVYGSASLVFLNDLKGKFLLDFLILSQGAGSFSWVLISINNLRDYENDKASDKLTLPIILGVRWFKAITILFLLAGNFLFYLILSGKPNHLLYFSVFFIAFLIIKNILLEKKLNQTLGLTALNYLVVGIWFFFLY